MFGRRKYKYFAVEVNEDGKADSLSPSSLAGESSPTYGWSGLELRLDTPLHKGDIVRVNKGKDNRKASEANYFEVVSVLVYTDRTNGDKQVATEYNRPFVLVRKVSNPCVERNKGGVARPW